MTRFVRTIALLGFAAVAAPPGGAGAQQTNEQLAARCAELGGIFDKYRHAPQRRLGRAGHDPDGRRHRLPKGRYTQGIKALEDLLQRNRISYPPA